MSAPSAGDAFSIVRAAALAVWPEVTLVEGRWTAVARNRVLDVCGSDHRPLVDLLLDVGVSVRPRLTASDTVHDAASWATHRAPLVHALIATRFLQPAVAGWAVDTWALLLGRIRETAVRATAAPRLDDALDDVTAAAPRTAPSRTAPSPTARAYAAPRAPAPAVAPVAPVVARGTQNRPSWAGGPVSFGVGARPKASALAALAAQGRLVVQRPVGGPQWLPIERRAAWLLVLLFVVCTGALWRALRAQHRSRDGNGAAAPAATGLLPTAARADEAALRVARPLVTPVAARGAVRAVGVGGRYRLTQDVHIVDGSESCAALAEALRGGRTSAETVSHEPGAPTLLFTGSAVTGTLAADGAFEAGPTSGRTDNIRWRLHLHGHFTADGFTAESELHTEAVIRWLSLQRCVVRSTLTGVRADP